jgi:hypothetical protein
MKIVQISIVLPLIASLVSFICAASAQLTVPILPSTPGHAVPTSPAAVYFDFSLPELRHAVPSIKGIAYDPNPSPTQLPAILSGVARSIDSALLKLPDLVSREDVNYIQTSADPTNAGNPFNAGRWNRVFRYLILCHRAADHSVQIEESRTDGKGHPVEVSASASGPRGLGFAYQWLLFSAANQPEFRFRYLGKQAKDGKQTFVLAFAQIPEKVLTPAHYQVDDKVLPFYFQGVIWVDQSTGEIVLLHTDLLASIPRLNLHRLTTEVHFNSVPIRDLNASFWLPREVDITSDQSTGTAEEDHRYGDYHLFHSTAKIIPTQEAPQ